MQTKLVTAVTITLLVIGIISAFLIIFDYVGNETTKLELLSHDKAANLALTEGKWDSDSLRDKKIQAKLLHITNNGFTFEVDEKTQVDEKLFMTKFEEFENKYVWLVQIDMIGGSNKSWYYLIDASSGKMLHPDEELFAINVQDPETSIKNNVPITQAQGDITIVFSQGISEDKFKSSPFPAQLVVTKMDTVTWFNNDTVAHSVTSGYPEQDEFAGRMFDSGIIFPQNSFSYTFSDERITEYSYFCSFHSWMRGSVIVQEIP